MNNFLFQNQTTPKHVSVLVLDIDGTVRESKDDALGRFVNGPEDVRVFPEAVQLMQEWRERGGRIVGLSNQGGIAMGFLTPQKMAAAMVETVRQCRNLFDRVAVCPHHPEAPEPSQSRCWCRKPSPGLLVTTLQAMGQDYSELYPPHMGLFVGDRPEDRECAKLAGFDFMDASDWRATTGQHAQNTKEVPDEYPNN